MADDYSVLVSSHIPHSANAAVRKWLIGYSGRKMNLPSRFLPRPDFLAWHRDNVFLE